MNFRGKIFGSISAAVILLSGIGEVAARTEPGSVTVYSDRGGRLFSYALRLKKLQHSGTRMSIRGGCYSACTLFLALPRHQVCVAPRATFGFHLPFGSSAAGNRVAASYMLRSYPGWVRTWIRNNGGLSRQVISMRYSYASKFLPTCASRYAQKSSRVASSAR